MYAKIKPWFDKHGVPARVENSAGSGMPDMIYCTKQVIMYIELKIIKSGKIHLRPYQYAYATRVLPHIDTHLYWFMCYQDDHIRMYTFDVLRDYVVKEQSKGKVTIDVSGIQPDAKIYSIRDFETWLHNS